MKKFDKKDEESGNYAYSDEVEPDYLTDVIFVINFRPICISSLTLNGPRQSPNNEN